MRILAIDVGGTHVKVRLSDRDEERQVRSGPDMSAERMVAAVKELASDWDYDAVSLGYPGPVLHGRPVSDPYNLGGGWAGFDFEKAFGCPVKVLNDAAMQALGSYQGGRMLFLGLGTGLGSAMIVDGVLEPMELGHLPYRDERSFEDEVGQRGLDRLGEARWKEAVNDVVARLRAALQPEYVVLGGGNVRLLEQLPEGARRGDNDNAFVGAFRLWEREQGEGSGEGR